MSKADAPSRVLLVVPTLGDRPDFLPLALASIRDQRSADIVIVAPSNANWVREVAQEFKASFVEDPGSLAAAINKGISQAKDHHEYVSWLGDDDVLEPGSLKVTVDALDANPRAVLAYGDCRYINDAGRELWISRAGKWAPRILNWGPDLIPQPGMLIRRSAWIEVGGLDESYRLAFDLDLLLKLKRVGALHDVNRIVSSFRWHADSRTVGDRSLNVAETEVAKRRYLTPSQARWKWFWERPVRVATRIAAWEVNRRAMKVQS